MEGIKKSSKNKLYTLSYFRKRLKNSSISSLRLINKYSKNDSRYWTILIDPSKKNLLCTCYKDSPIDYYFSVQTENVPHFVIKTESMEVVINNIKELIGFNECSDNERQSNDSNEIDQRENSSRR